MSANTTASPRTPIRCARPAAPDSTKAPCCAGCGLTAKAAVHRIAHGRPDPRWRQAWTVRAVWSALAAAEADLETVWLVLSGRTCAARRFCARCAPAGHRPGTGCGRWTAIGAARTPTARSWCSAPRRCPGCPTTSARTSGRSATCSGTAGTGSPTAVCAVPPVGERACSQWADLGLRDFCARERLPASSTLQLERAWDAWPAERYRQPQRDHRRPQRPPRGTPSRSERPPHQPAWHRGKRSLTGSWPPTASPRVTPGRNLHNKHHLSPNGQRRHLPRGAAAVDLALSQLVSP